MAQPAPGNAQAPFQQDWVAFQRRFVTPEGRITDNGNRNISHSEGQGYGLLGALRANDQPSFDLILGWTMANLRRSTDALFAWRWDPSTSPNVTDLNNASDGDIFIAWALLLAAEQWRNPTYLRLGQAIGRDLLRRCVVNVGSRWVLLPGAYGFQSPQRIVINLSYYAFAALRAISRHVPDPAWPRLETDGLALIRDSRFGMYGLPPDWLELPRDGGRPVMARGWPMRFSFDAVRIPLNLCWAGHTGEPAVAAALSFWLSEERRSMPAWIDLMTNVVPGYPAPPGMVAVARLAAAAQAGQGTISRMPSVGSAQDYYAAALVLQARIAWQDLSLSTPAHR
ncbi:glycosyl hydrolase family 8 [Sediminicoccus sp. KRV36]|uniref:glycosyl hydrolase family 8 n=1 Tax=Sediminicoccus sp. KRV36 TaxID=3133721 RepID=UPI00200C88E7|nr:glycosyl hydrolase family 8 [Sediminicoccus rosea]UPY37051.1 glycosyl hydrolase family 5 [Sediminicoccus rosea]